jgi:hypothetical protein
VNAYLHVEGVQEFFTLSPKDDYDENWVTNASKPNTTSKRVQVD